MENAKRDMWATGLRNGAGREESWSLATEIVPDDHVCLGANLLDETSWFRVTDIEKSVHGVWLRVRVGDYRQRVFRSTGESVKVRRSSVKIAA